MRPDQLGTDMLRLEVAGGRAIAGIPRRSLYRTLFYRLLEGSISARDYVRLRRRITGSGELRGVSEETDRYVELIEEITRMEEL